MRRTLIVNVLPAVFCLLPPLAALLIVLALPDAAKRFYFQELSNLDLLILGIGGALFLVQIVFAWRALRWRGMSFDERPDNWLTHLAQAAEWFPLLGLLGTVAGILQTFSSIGASAGGEPVPPEEIIRRYAPAITATGSGLLMALLNILPTWVVLLGRQMIRALGGGEGTAVDGAPSDSRVFSKTR